MRYLAIGHICQDLLPDGWMFGGAATYSSRMAHALGCQVQVLTSLRSLMWMCARRWPILKWCAFHPIAPPPSRMSTPSAGRHQTLHAVAERLTPDRFPATLAADVVHLAPIAQEVDLAWLDRFPGALIGVTPQGWLRQWDAQGRISPIAWADAAKVLPRADAVIISIEDVAHDEALVQQWAAQARMLVVTRGAHGCTVHQNNTSPLCRRIPSKLWTLPARATSLPRRFWCGCGRAAIRSRRRALPIVWPANRSRGAAWTVSPHRPKLINVVRCNHALYLRSRQSKRRRGQDHHRRECQRLSGSARTTHAAHRRRPAGQCHFVAGLAIRNEPVGQAT